MIFSSTFGYSTNKLSAYVEDPFKYLVTSTICWYFYSCRWVWTMSVNLQSPLLFKSSILLNCLLQINLQVFVHMLIVSNYVDPLRIWKWAQVDKIKNVRHIGQFYYINWHVFIFFVFLFFFLNVCSIF